MRKEELGQQNMATDSRSIRCLWWVSAVAALFCLGFIAGESFEHSLTATTTMYKKTYCAQVISHFGCVDVRGGGAFFGSDEMGHFCIILDAKMSRRSLKTSRLLVLRRARLSQQSEKEFSKTSKTVDSKSICSQAVC